MTRDITLMVLGGLIGSMLVLFLQVLGRLSAQAYREEQQTQALLGREEVQRLNDRFEREEWFDE